jgi:transposase-like protein
MRGLSLRDVESLCEKAGLGKLSRSTVSRVCEELRQRYQAFRRRDLYGRRERGFPRALGCLWER